MEQSPSWKLIVTQLVKNYPAFNGTRGFRKCSHDTITGPYPEPGEAIFTLLHHIS